MCFWILLGIAVVVIIVIIVTACGPGGGSSSSQPRLGCCFPQDTQVATPDGSRSIQTLTVGDNLLCLDYATGKQVTGRVERVDTATEPELREICFKDAGSICCSPSQRLWNGKEWIRTRDVEGGTQLDQLRVALVRSFQWDNPVHSFVVSPHDNFIVQTGFNQSPVICHDNSS